MNNRVNVRIDDEKKQKAIFVLKSRGKTLSEEVRKIVEKLAKKYDKIKK